MRQDQPGAIWTPLKIILVYVITSGVWILFSDRLLAILVPDPRAFLLAQTLKGWFFVLATAVLLYGLMQRYTRSLRQSQSQLQESEAWYRRIVTTAEEGIWVLDNGYRTTYVNQRMADMLGYSTEEMLGRSIFDFVDPAMREEMERHLRTPQPGGTDVYEFRFLRKDGSELWAIISASPILDRQEHFSGAFSMITDITERHRSEEYQREFARRTIEAATEGKLLIREREEILRMAGPPIFSQEITRAEDLESARHAVTDIAHAAGMNEERIFDFVLCISEATTNAVKHAGSGTLSLHTIDTSLLAVVSDHGPGIPAINLPELALKRGYTTTVSLGMGYKAMISMADRVYLATSPDGTTVAIAMALQAPEAPAITIFALPGASW